MIANNNVHRMLVDNGSSVDILYFQAFERMGLKVSDLKLLSNPVYDLTSNDLGRIPKIVLCDGKLSNNQSAFSF